MTEIPLDEVKKVFETNTFAILRVCRAITPIMAKRGSGTIVNIGSVVGEVYVLHSFVSGKSREMTDGLVMTVQRNAVERYLLRVQSGGAEHQRGALHGAQAIGHLSRARRPGRDTVEHREQRPGELPAAAGHVVWGVPSRHNPAHTRQPSRAQYAQREIRRDRRDGGSTAETTAVHDTWWRRVDVFSFQMASEKPGAVPDMALVLDQTVSGRVTPTKNHGLPVPPASSACPL